MNYDADDVLKIIASANLSLAGHRRRDLFDSIPRRCDRGAFASGKRGHLEDSVCRVVRRAVRTQ